MLTHVSYLSFPLCLSISFSEGSGIGVGFGFGSTGTSFFDILISI